MKTYLLKTEEGKITGFEIPNSFISSNSIARFLKKVPGCTVKWVRKIFGKSEVHVKFEFEGVVFEAWEPFGDNSRIHIGPANETQEDIVSSLESKVRATKRFLW